MLRSILSFCLSFLRTTTQVRLENLFLRKQLEIAVRSSPKPQFKPTDRFFLGLLTGLFHSWRDASWIVTPDTVIRWHRESFRVFWKWKSRSTPGRPAIPQAQISLIKQMARENPLWGAPRIHGELLKLGCDISESTVLRYMPKKTPRTTRQRWKTFLKNHSAQIVSVDFLVVPTITFKPLYVLVFLSHARRRIIHFNVTAHPTTQWCAQQLRNAFSDAELPRFLIRDRDTKFGELFTATVSALGVEPLWTAYRAPWQNGYCERLIGSIRRECLDHLIIMTERNLRAILKTYILYYNTQRTHLGINKDSPQPRKVQAEGEIDKVAVANGLHHYYYRIAA